MLGLEFATIGGFDIHGGGNGVKVAKFSWKKSPRTQRVPLPRRHGSRDQTAFYSGRLFELAGYIVGLSATDAQTRLDEFEEALALTGNATLFQFLLTGRADMEQAAVRIDGDLAYQYDALLPTVLRWAVTLFSEDPRIYRAEVTSESYGPSGGGTLTVRNRGNFVTPPVYTLTGDATEPAIYNATTGAAIATNGLVMGGGDTLVVDVAARSLTLNGVDIRQYLAPSGTSWGSLYPGDNVLSVTGSGFTGATTLQVDFHDARV